MLLGEESEGFAQWLLLGQKKGEKKMLHPLSFFIKPPCLFLEKEGLPVLIVAGAEQGWGHKPSPLKSSLGKLVSQPGDPVDAGCFLHNAA